MENKPHWVNIALREKTHKFASVTFHYYIQKRVKYQQKKEN